MLSEVVGVNLARQTILSRVLTLWKDYMRRCGSHLGLANFVFHAYSSTDVEQSKLCLQACRRRLARATPTSRRQVASHALLYLSGIRKTSPCFPSKSGWGLCTYEPTELCSCAVAEIKRSVSAAEHPAPRWLVGVCLLQPDLLYCRHRRARPALYAYGLVLAVLLNICVGKE